MEGQKEERKIEKIWTSQGQNPKQMRDSICGALGKLQWNGNLPSDQI